MKILRLILTLEKGAYVSLISQGLSSLCNFLTMVFLAKTLTEHDFGLYSLLNNSLLIVSSIFASLVSIPLRVLGASVRDEDANIYFTSQFALQVFLSIALFIVGIIALKLSSLSNFSMDISLCFCLISANLHEFMRSVNTTRFRWKYLIAGDIVAYVCRMAILIVIAIAEMVSVASVFLVIGVTYLVGFLIGLISKVKFRLNLDWSGKILKTNWEFGKWLLLESIVFTISTQIYIYFIALGVDVFSAGAFAAVQILINSLNIMLIGVMNYAIPVARKRLCEEGYQSWKVWLQKICMMLFSLTSVVCILLSIFAKALLAIFFKPIYSDFAYIVPILGVSFALTSITTVLSAAFRTAEMPEVGLWSKCLSAIVTIVLGYPLVLNWGILGAAFGMVITQICWVLVGVGFIYFNKALSAERVLIRISKNRIAIEKV